MKNIFKRSIALLIVATLLLVVATPLLLKSYHENHELYGCYCPVCAIISDNLSFFRALIMAYAVGLVTHVILKLFLTHIKSEGNVVPSLCLVELKIQMND